MSCQKPGKGEGNPTFFFTTPLAQDHQNFSHTIIA